VTGADGNDLLTMDSAPKLGVNGGFTIEHTDAASVNLDAYLSYQFVLLGPESTGNISVYSEGKAGLDSLVPGIQSPNKAYAGYALYGYALPILGTMQPPSSAVQVGDGYGSSLSRAFDVSGNYKIFTDVPYTITMEATLHLDAQFPDVSLELGGYAYVDPIITALDPGYSLVFSDGINNSLAGLLGTPEPSTRTLMLAGFAGLGFAGWWASRRTASRAA
jgi:hypothetical protein